MNKILGKRTWAVPGGRRPRTAARHQALLGLAFGMAVAVNALAAPARPPAETVAPHLRRDGAAVQLIVDGAPFVIRGGELGNSTGEPGYLRAFWPKLVALKLNTLLVPVYWDQIEPAPGQFDLSTLDGLLRDARAHNMRLVLLWFGSWKNSMSCYAPAWVKNDSQAFPRARDSAGRPLEILTPFSEANLKADARAFARLMRHLRESDSALHTVILVQVENEIGMIPEARDRSDAADREYARAVPPELLRLLAAQRDALVPELRERWLRYGGRAAGSWEEVFGPGPDSAELFMAWHFARYTNEVIRAGKAEYPLPMFVNAALIRPGYQPGQYPSAGPLPHLFDIWRAAAPDCDFFAPDIYFPNLAEWCRRYRRQGNPLFIPEALRSAEASVNALYAVAAHGALGFSPFAIESIEEPAATLLRQSYDLLEQLAPLLAAHRGAGSMAGLLPDSAEQRQPQQIALGRCVLSVTYETQRPPALADGVIVPAGATTVPKAPGPAGGLVIATASDEYLFAGTGVTVTFGAATPGDPVIGILSVEEGRLDNGEWVHERWLGGDQTHQGRHVRLEPGRFSLQRVKLYRYH